MTILASELRKLADLLDHDWDKNIGYVGVRLCKIVGNIIKDNVRQV